MHKVVGSSEAKSSKDVSAQHLQTSIILSNSNSYPSFPICKYNFLFLIYPIKKNLMAYLHDYFQKHGLPLNYYNLSIQSTFVHSVLLWSMWTQEILIDKIARWLSAFQIVSEKMALWLRKNIKKTVNKTLKNIRYVN